MRPPDGAAPGDEGSKPGAQGKADAAIVSHDANALERQRHRRATRLRIDYYPSDEAAKVLASLRSAGGNASSVINHLIVTVGGVIPDSRRARVLAKVSPRAS